MRGVRQTRLYGAVKSACARSPLRSVKDAYEIERLRMAAAGVDRIAAALQAGEIALVGRTEADVSAELGQRILAEGHHRVNFAIVAAGENAASPHHEAGHRVIRDGEIVLCDFGGTWIDDDGDLLELNTKLNRWELSNRSWCWNDIAKGYKQESKRNYNNKIARELENELRRQSNGKFCNIDCY